MISSSSSNWLDRLRSSRGFPTGEEPDLDRFISSSSSGSVESAATQSESAARREKTAAKWAPPPGEFSGVLCDLFNMDGGSSSGGGEASRTFSKKKSSRKQANPKFFCVDLLPSSSSENNHNNNNNNNISNNNDNGNYNSSNNNSNENDGGNFRVEDELNLRVVEDDLKGYTRSEVTVIDTSFEEWKSDKWVFRKNDEWRIKEKKSKGKSRVFCGGKKKKKLLDNNNLGDKKLVDDNKDDDDNQLMKKKIEDLSSLHPNKGRPRTVKEREPFREREQFVGKVPRKRFPCPRPPEKVRNESSPVVLIKSIPLNDPNTVAKISKTPHKKRPKQMKILNRSYINTRSGALTSVYESKDGSSSHGCFSLLKLTTSLHFGEERAFFWPISIQQRKKLLILSKPRKESADFADSGQLFSIFQLLGIGEKGIQDILVRNPGLEQLPIDSIRSRIRGLQSVGLDEVFLSRLIIKHPDVLTAEEVDVLIEFARNDLDNKIESIQIKRLLMGVEPRFIAGFDKKVNLLIENGVPQEKIAHVLNKVNLNKAFCLKSCEEIQRLLTFLSRFNAVGIVAKRPLILNYDLDTQLVPRIGFLQRLSGGDTDGVGEVLNRLPAILAYSLEHLQDQVEFFRSSVGLTDLEIFKIVLVFPNVMSASRQRKLQPRIQFLKDCGLDSGEIYRFLIKSPLFLGLSFEKNLSYKLAMLVKIGYAYRTKDLAMAMGAVSRTSFENLQEVVGLFLNYGFSCDDIVAMSRKQFQILQYNPRSLEEKMEYLVEDMDREIGELLSFPAFLGYNLDKRIKLRYELKKKFVGDDMSLNKLLSVSTAEFSKTKKKLVKVGCSLGEEVDTH